MLRDIRYGFRQLKKSPVLVCAAIVSLALGIGANTAIFTLINSVMLQYLPVKDPARLVLFYDGISTGVYSGNAFRGDYFSYPFYRYLREHNDSFANLCAFRQSNDQAVFHVAGESDTGPWEQAKVHLVSGNYFAVLGVRAAIGRVFSPSDDTPGAPRTAVLSYPFWRDRFHADGGVLGRAVVLNGTTFTVIGVAAAEFFGERIQPAPEFWLPLAAQPQVLHSASYLEARDVYWLNILGRLKPGVSMAGAQSVVNVRLHQFYLEQAGNHVSADVKRQIEAAHVQLKPGGGGISGLRYLYSRPLHLLMAVVAVVLLIACANVATLLLARGAARRAEFVTRLALGASRMRLVRQVLTESVLLSCFGGAAGLLLAWWSVKLLVWLLRVPSVAKVRPDPLVLAFTLALCLVTGLLFGILPALRYGRDAVKPVARGTGGQSLVALQVALSTILLFGAGLLARSLLAVEKQNIGFQRDNILVVRTDASLAGYQEAQCFGLYRELGERLSQLPGVQSASMARFTPNSGYSSSGDFSIAGYTPPPGLKMNVYDVPVGPGFFETLGIPILLGRGISVRDTPTAPAVAVVNQTFVNIYLAHRNPVGERIGHGSPFAGPGAEIVGVAGDSRFYDVREKAPPMVFYSFWQKPTAEAAAVLRTNGNPFGVADEVRKAFRGVNNRLPLLAVTTQDAEVENTLRQQKMISSLCGVFGLIALALTAVGIYGIGAYAVSGRTHEIGVRMAIGAQPQQVLWLILRDSLVLAGGGLVVGMPLAIAGSRWLKSFLFGVEGFDPLTIGLVLGLMVALASMAGYFPARRAAGIDPMRVLRHE